MSVRALGREALGPARISGSTGVSYRNSARGYLNGRGLTMLTPPALEGELLVALAAHQGGVITSFTTPSGWTLIESYGNYSGYAAFYRVQPAGGQFNVTFTTAGNTNATTAVIWSLYGHTTSRSPIGNKVGSLVGSSTTHVAPDFTTTAVGSFVLANYFTYSSSAPSPSVLNGWTAEAFGSGGTQGSYGGARKSMPNVGSTDTFTFATGNSVSWSFYQVEVLSALAYQ